MKITTKSSAVYPLFLWLIAVALAMPSAVTAKTSDTFLSEDLLPYGFSMTSLQGGQEVDPYMTINLEAVGLGADLAKVELSDSAGNSFFKAENQSQISLPSPLAFGTVYTLKVTAERSWLGQSALHEIKFTTVIVPKLTGDTFRTLEPDSSLVLHFDRPVRELEAKGDLKLVVESDAPSTDFRLMASEYAQDRRYPVQLHYKTATGVPLPPLSFELLTPPPLAVETNMKGLTNLGSLLPLKLTFSEMLADRDNAFNHLKVHSQDGDVINGKWRWIRERQLRFTPDPAWPASSTIEVTADLTALRSVRGGMLEQALVEQFSTGTDRKLYVYLDKQQVQAVENGEVVRTFKVSTGKRKTPTVTGSFYIYDRYRHKTMRSDVGRGQRGYYEVKDVPYTQFFHRDYAFHGAFWHNNFGRPASHGCINMATKDKNKRWPKVSEDAGWLYRWAALGVPVTVKHKKPSTMTAGTGSKKNKKQSQASEMASSQVLSKDEVVSR